MSNTIDSGTQVRIPCSLGGGAFPDEYLITIDTADGPLSGFVDSDDVTKDADAAYVLGIVCGAEGDRIVVSLPGAFFTTTGIAHFPRRILENTL